MNLTNILSDAGIIILIINFLMYAKSFTVKNKALCVFTIYLFVISAIQVLSWYLHSKRIDNIFVSHFYFIGQFVFLSFFYKELFIRKKDKLFINIMIIAVLSVVIVSYILLPEMLYRFNVIEIVLTSLPLVVYSVMYVFNSLSMDNRVYSYINAGILFYVLLSTLIFLSGNIIINLSDYFNDITWFINSVLYIVFQILIFIEWWKSFSLKKIK